MTRRATSGLWRWWLALVVGAGSAPGCSDSSNALVVKPIAVADGGSADGSTSSVDSSAIDGSSIGSSGDANSDAAIGKDPSKSDTQSRTQLPAEFCGKACAAVPADSCLRMPGGPSGDCAGYCNKHASNWSPAVGAAFATCVATHPLCFEKMEDCLLAELYPNGTTVNVSVAARELDAYNGKTLRVWHDPDKPTQFGNEVTIQGGQADMAWSVQGQYLSTSGLLLLMYIDADGDGVCTPTPDLTHSGYATWTGDLLAPAFALTISPATMNDAAFVCGALP